MTDREQQTTLPIAGWYDDPAGDDQLRWWGGLAWTEHVKPLETPALAPETTLMPEATLVPDTSWSYTARGGSYVPFAGDARTPIAQVRQIQSANTVAIWILAFTPLLAVLIQFVDSGTGLLLSMPFLIAAALLPLTVFIALAVWDRAALRTIGLRPTSLWWLLLPSPIIYLIVRRVGLRHQGVISNAPSNVFVITLFAAAALLYPLVAAQVGLPPVMAQLGF